RRGWPLENFAFAPIETRHVPARQRCPVDAVAIDVPTTRRKSFDGRSALHGQLVDFGKRGLRWVGTWRNSNNGAADTGDRSPMRSIWRRRNGVKSPVVAPVLCWIDWLVRFDVRIPFPVAVRVHDESSPALRLLLVVRLLEHLRVEPAYGTRATAARPERAVGI